ncbi:ParA family protein [Pontibacillus salipaludis]|uniref:Sporulation initiation inhibitor Soj n=1 Tax=Pontibacillus salipaludis TaxID=1697394 RepID=A0ABQ1QKG4_9BACI|nr:ParA family protein [Pontibacillus salipaludis]GGD29116.1 sporulation initiation inhibitor Soj [Pontibacillus salipaludis]
MTQKIAVSTNKGGVLKTSLTTNLAGVLSSEGHKVLIIDTDNQGNAAISFGVNPDNLDNSIYDVLVDHLNPEEAILNVHENIDLLPANDDMSFFEFDVLSEASKYPYPFSMLKEAFKNVDLNNWDYVLIDTPPTLGLTQGNVLSFAQDILIPFQPESYSMRSLLKILRAISDFKQSHNPNLNVLGVVPTLVDSRTTLHTQIIQECRRYGFENDIRVFETVIPRSVRFANSVAFERKPATLTEGKKNPLVKSYWDLYKEVMEDGQENA